MVVKSTRLNDDPQRLDLGLLNSGIKRTKIPQNERR